MIKFFLSYGKETGCWVIDWFILLNIYVFMHTQIYVFLKEKIEKRDLRFILTKT